MEYPNFNNNFKTKKLNKSLLIMVGMILLLGFIWISKQDFLNDFNLVPSVDRARIDLNSADKNDLEFVSPIGSATIESVSEKVGPSVVSILTSTEMENIFGQNTQRSGAGSGVILSKDGYVITNKHVVDKASKIAIITAKGETFETVELIIADPLNDLAFLKIVGADNLTPIEVGDSKSLKVGQSVLAIGNALGEYQNSVTSGIISGISRDITAQGPNFQAESLNDLIQTDAAINSGNSGGALVNAGGQLVGINTAVAQGANGIGFAIPIGAAKGLIKQLGQENIAKAYLGVNYISLTPALAKHYQISQVRGALVDKQSGIVAGSPAEKAGLKNGDVIVKINNQVVGENGGVATLISEFKPGEEIEVFVERQNQTLNFKVKLEAYRI